ncbi:MAG TPA: hypothetical protein VOA87_03375 [Thermoanaerobaculia bacterium]|nr:hypothetical protein [Thermoanaerobaculia bacterium]
MNARAVILLVIMIGTTPLAATAAKCPDGKVAFRDAIQAAIRDSTAALDDSTVPSDRQVAAPSSASGGSALVDHASFPAILGSALNDGLVTTGDRSATVDLNLFAFETLIHPDYLSSQSEYQKHSTVRKFGGSITLGGTGDRLGKTDPPVMAKDLGDIIDYELRYRLTKSTDRREGYNATRLVKAVMSSDQEILKQFGDFHTRHFTQIKDMSDTSGCVPETEMKTFLDESRQELSEIGAEIAKANDELQKAVNDIDGRPVWSIVAGGSQRRQQFGPNSFRLGLRAELFKTTGHENTFNLDWSRKQPLLSMAAMTTLKGSFQHTYVWKSKVAPDGIDISVSASFEHNQNVPDALHPDIFQANAKLEYSLSKSVKIPISISWANHADLLTNEHNISGHFGFTVDFSKLAKPAS